MVNGPESQSGTLAALRNPAIGPICIENGAHRQGRRRIMPALASGSIAARPLLVIASLAGVLVAATLGLWAYYGTAVFFEVVRAGWVACF